MAQPTQVKVETQGKKKTPYDGQAGIVISEADGVSTVKLDLVDEPVDFPSGDLVVLC